MMTCTFQGYLPRFAKMALVVVTLDLVLPVGAPLNDDDDDDDGDNDDDAGGGGGGGGDGRRVAHGIALPPSP